MHIALALLQMATALFSMMPKLLRQFSLINDIDHVAN